MSNIRITASMVRHFPFNIFHDREFPGGPVVRTWYFHCQEPRFNSSSGNQDPTSHTAQPINNNNIFHDRTLYILTNKALLHRIQLINNERQRIRHEDSFRVLKCHSHSCIIEPLYTAQLLYLASILQEIVSKSHSYSCVSLTAVCLQRFPALTSLPNFLANQKLEQPSLSWFSHPNQSQSMSFDQ